MRDATRRDPRPNEDGAAALEAVLVLPLALLAVMATLTVACWFHARNTALAAAQEGVRAGRVYGSSPAVGRTTALVFAREVGGSFLRAPRADTSGSDNQTVVVRVGGQALSLIPGLRLSVSQVARAPREVFTTETRGSGSAGP